MNVSRDDNRVPVSLGVSNADGITTVPFAANAALHRLYISDGTTGSDLSDDSADRDENRVTSWIAASSADGKTPVPIYADLITKALLIKTT